MLSAKNFLVKELKISNKEAIAYILEGKMQINGSVAKVTQAVGVNDEVEVEGRILKAAPDYLYLAYYKPRGIESTLNKNIKDNLAQALQLNERVYPVGRLDKESEGLLLLTNDGYTFNKIIDSKLLHEKEYEVKVHKSLTNEAIEKLALGVPILGTVTRQANVERTGEDSFRIILTEGMNRQIRRMCYKLEYDVTELKRTRIVTIRLGDLLPSQYRILNKEEVTELRCALNPKATSSITTKIHSRKTQLQ